VALSLTVSFASRARHVLLWVGTCLAAASPVHGQTDLATQLAATPAVLQPGDAVRIAVHRMAELSGEIDIGVDSTLSHPLYRGFRAAGLSAPDLDARVRTHLLRYEANPQFVAEPLFRVAVGGEVRQPSLLALRPEVTILQAVARAGGVTDRARLHRTQLVRGGEVFVLDLSRPELGHGLATVRSGDQIFIPRAGNVFRDYIAPSASIVAAIATIARVFMR
jgi:protein involved in polysaccharide export with SLBB domain